MGTETCSTFDQRTENERFRELRTTFASISQKRKEEEDSKGVLPPTAVLERKVGTTGCAESCYTILINFVRFNKDASGNLSTNNNFKNF
jgi:hypothetical protein